MTESKNDKKADRSEAGKKKVKAERQRYKQWQKDMVSEEYSKCRTKADKLALARRAGIATETRLYNLASRLNATGSNDGGRYVGNEGSSRLIERLDDVHWSERDDEYLRSEFGRRHVEDIASHLRHSEPATLYRARKIKLRKPVKYWRLEKVSAWLGIEPEQLRSMRELGIEVHPLTAPDGSVAVELIATTSLARWMNAYPDQVADLAADEFFIREIEETVQEILNKETHFELCSFLSHGHVCFNPRSLSSYGFYCTNSDRYVAGNDPACSVKIFTIEDLAPER